MSRTSGGSGGGGGAVALLSKQVLASKVATVTFSAIAGTYNSLWLLASCATDYATGTDDLQVQVNQDSGNHYSAQFNSAHATTVAGVVENASTPFFTRNGCLATAAGTASMVSAVDLKFPGYAGTTTYKSVVGHVGDPDAPSSAGSLNAVVWTWESTSAITRLDLTTVQAANFIVGSAFYLYGIT